MTYIIIGQGKNKNSESHQIQALLKSIFFASLQFKIQTNAHRYHHSFARIAQKSI